MSEETMKKLLKAAARRARPKDKSYRRKGDAARDARDWLQAAELYQQHLDRNPEDFPIWVQRGHALKEAGLLDEAEASYAMAARLKDNDPDLLLSRGHLAKQRGELAIAQGFYQLSHAIDRNPFAAEELTGPSPDRVAGLELEDAFDPVFYWELYFPHAPYDAQRLARDYEERVKEFYKENPPPLGDQGEPSKMEFYGSRTALAKAHGMPPGRWLDCFSAREFCLLSFDHIGQMLNDSQALAAFLEEGVSRLAPISFSYRFDLGFYREVHPHLAELSGPDLYRIWLVKGLETSEPATPEAWLNAHQLGISEFPDAFDWVRYSAIHLHGRASRWQALQHLLHSPLVPSQWPLHRAGAVEFLLAAGHRFELLGQLDRARACYEHTTTFAAYAPATAHRLADIHHRKGEWEQALAAYNFFHSSGQHTLWSTVFAADAAAKVEQYDEAFRILLAGKPAYGGDQPWLNTVEAVVSAQFETVSKTARELYARDRRPAADDALTGVAAQLAERWSELLDFPTRTFDPNGKVVILATHALAQCTYYRIEQKTYFLDSLDIEYEIFDYSDITGFLAALPGSSAAIFYRLPALPQVLKGILAAKKQGIPSYYEIDDLIFDNQNYPDSLESFQGQIDKDTYLGLLYGTPLYRSAMALCDFGIASTTPLAREMKKVVRTGECFVIRNGLDDRNIGTEALPGFPAAPQGRVRIVYGSATLAHNQDFHDMAGAALCTVLAENPNVELIVIGHLALGEMFDPFSSQITRVELLKDTYSYWSLLAACDINLAVLSPGLMSDCKSEIKWLEAAVVGVPSIVSSTATYREVIDDGRTGFLAATPQDWTSALRRLVSEPEPRKKIGAAARQQALAEYGVSAGARALQAALAASGTPALPRPKQRVLIVNVFYPPQSIGGATRVVAGNIDDFLSDPDATKRFEFAVAATDFDAHPAYRRRNDSHRGIPVFRIAPPMVGDLDWRPDDPKMKTWFETVLSQFKPDLVHFHCMQRLTVAPINACREAGVPYIVSVHDGWWLSDYQFLFDENARERSPGDELYLGGKPGIPLSETLKRLARLRGALNGAARILTPSENFTQLYRQAGFDRAETVANGLPNLDLKERRPTGQSRVRLGHIGDTSPHKGFDLVEAALRQGRFSNLELLALGHGRNRDEETHDVWGETPIRLRGRVPQDQIADLYANLDVLLAPSACRESYGLVTREAHMAGLWVVASDRGAIGEDVVEGKDGFVIDVSSPAALHNVLAAINDRPELFVQSPPRRADIRSAADQARDLLAIYQGVAEELAAG